MLIDKFYRSLNILQINQIVAIAQGVRAIGRSLLTGSRNCPTPLALSGGDSEQRNAGNLDEEVRK